MTDLIAAFELHLLPSDLGQASRASGRQTLRARGALSLGRELRRDGNLRRARTLTEKENNTMTQRIVLKKRAEPVDLLGWLHTHDLVIEIEDGDPDYEVSFQGNVKVTRHPIGMAGPDSPARAVTRFVKSLYSVTIETPAGRKEIPVPREFTGIDMALLESGIPDESSVRGGRVR